MKNSDSEVEEECCRSWEALILHRRDLENAENAFKLRSCGLFISINAGRWKITAVNFYGKMINYRGGIVRFVIPRHWEEEYDPEGRGMFYEDMPDSGTLRLNVMEFEYSKPAEEMARLALEKIDEPLRDRAATSVVRCVLPSGFGMCRYVQPAVEGDKKLHLHRWNIFVPVPPHNLRIVMFYHTVLAEQEEDPHIAEELELIDEAIRAAEVLQEAGGGGAFHQDRDI